MTPDDGPGDGEGVASLGGDVLAGVLEQLPDPVVIVDAQARLVWGNRAAEAWSGWELDEMRGRPATDLVHPDDASTALSSLESVQGKDVGTTIEMRFRNRLGAYSRFEVRGGVIGGAGIVLVLRDQTERRRWEVAAGDASLLQAVIDAAPAITMLLDGGGHLRGASRALTGILGHGLEAALGLHLSDLASPDHADTVASEVAAAIASPGSRSFEADFDAAGRAVPMNVTVVNLLDDRSVEGLVVTAVDVSALAEMRDRLAHLAGHDQLTGLPNRSLLFDRLAHALDRNRREGGAVGVVYCDVDGFKAINDAHGHAAGDRVLVELADRLRAVSRASDTVARIGGDELVVVTEGGADAGQELIARIAEAVRPPIRLPSGATVEVTVSAGLADTEGITSPDELLDRADAEMYRVKHHARRPSRRRRGTS